MVKMKRLILSIRILRLMVESLKLVVFVMLNLFQHLTRGHKTPKQVQGDTSTIKRTIPLSIALIILASACAPKPVIVDVKDYKDKYLDCNQLEAAIRSAERFKIAANAEEGFRLGYIFPPNAALGIYRLNRAESAANKRMEYIKRLAEQKGCYAEIKPQIINPQILDYPNESHLKKDGYNFYRYNGQPQYRPSSSFKATTQYLNPQDYYNGYLSR